MSTTIFTSYFSIYRIFTAVSTEYLLQYLLQYLLMWWISTLSRLVPRYVVSGACLSISPAVTMLHDAAVCCRRGPAIQLVSRAPSTAAGHCARELPWGARGHGARAEHSVNKNLAVVRGRGKHDTIQLPCVLPHTSAHFTPPHSPPCQGCSTQHSS